MQDLRLTGVHDDGEHLVLVDPAGQRYRLVVDEPLRAAVRRDRARFGQLQIQIEGALRPRDIQARIRAGADAQQVAAASGIPVEQVRRYEGPVLAEREHVASLAQRAHARRGQQAALGDLVQARLATRDGTVDDGGWDAWRKDDGSWTVALRFRSGSRDRVARWRFDLVSRSLSALDDEARWLCDGDESAYGGPGRGASERVYDVEADGWTPVDLLDTLRQRRGRLIRVAVPPAAHPPASAPHEAIDSEVLVLPDDPGEADPDVRTPEPAAASAPGPRRGRSRRASVPSWDEIVFGARRE